MDEQRRTIVITGVSRGLGAALVERLVEAGHAVAGCARSEDALEALAARHPGALLETCDWKTRSFDAVFPPVRFCGRHRMWHGAELCCSTEL